MPELVDNGRTGMLVTDIAGAVDAIEKTDRLDRAVIRARTVERFGVDRMVDEYVRVYEQAIANACSG